MYSKAIEAGVDIVDTAIGSLGWTDFQPSVQTLHYALEGSSRQPKLEVDSLERLGEYWGEVRKFYHDFESGMNAPHTEVYKHEMPGGQYSNLQQQSQSSWAGRPLA